MSYCGPDGAEGPVILGEAYFEETPTERRLAIAQRIREHFPGE